MMNARGKYLYFYCIGRQHRRTNCRLSYLAVADVEAAVERTYQFLCIPE
jgi:hypothetical protein